MQNFLPTLLLLITTVTATPTPIDLVRRECKYLAPSAIDILSESNPDTPSLGNHFSLSHEANPSRNTETVALTFTDIPATASGCVLQLAIPKLTHENEIASGTATQAEIWKTNPWTHDDAPTWSHPPHKDRMVSTTGFPTEVTDEKDVRWLASDTCSETMSYYVELSDWQNSEGDVDFENHVDGGDGDLGFRMVYGC
ncbi:hypothetical protein P170DRAFT_438323 [Aspergillus steynii IBT 23096]|uniref:Ubiquitin 3 binding protein But2 C-terminal domain-containing protein n=1 Tax=Aspergillus steynii IBT 23096 TaxID=1392250 RepID=A0A2I2G134_9EURO|nr:uncharacterized protein P170DRAFT_438323 [Aspergillus steynii IBT 23096]PLB46604.1 hypothetical protein P170DRAFT_438323 [Aspergillus steynii IBT 23096]